MADLPAILGGEPMRRQAARWPIGDEDARAVFEQALRDGTWAKYKADHCDRLERWLEQYHAVKFAHLCGSGNFAVETALRALQIGFGDEVILASYDYPGNFNTIHAVGAVPVLVDIEPRSWNLSLDAVREAIGPHTKAIVASHIHGGRVPMRALMELANGKGLRVVEDAAQAAGALIDGRRAGAWGDVGVLSFGGSKLLSAGRGGAILTSHLDVAHRARTLFLQRDGNLVAPMTELQAALLWPQCQKLDERNEVRWANVRALCEALVGLPGVRAFVDGSEPPLPGFFKLGYQIDEQAFGLKRERMIDALKAEGYAFDSGFVPAHRVRSPKRFRQGSALDEAKRAAAGCVQLHHPILLEHADEMRRLAAAWKRVHLHAEAIGR